MLIIIGFGVTEALLSTLVYRCEICGNHAAHRLTKQGDIVIGAQEPRAQARNRAEARERLFELIRQAAVKPTVRRKTRVPKSAKRERLESKKRRSGIKSLRQRKPGFD